MTYFLATIIEMFDDPDRNESSNKPNTNDKEIVSKGDSQRSDSYPRLTYSLDSRESQSTIYL